MLESLTVEVAEPGLDDIDESEPTHAAGRVAPRRQAAPPNPIAPGADAVLVEADLLVEQVSIDGMCGVY